MTQHIAKLFIKVFKKPEYHNNLSIKKCLVCIKPNSMKVTNLKISAWIQGFATQPTSNTFVYIKPANLSYLSQKCL